MIIPIKHRVNDPALIDQRYGIECDVWAWVDHDSNNQLIISHDCSDGSFLLNSVLDERLPIIAINAKTTGLKSLKEELKSNINYFIFDAAVPEALNLIKAGLKVYTRHSEYEHHPSFYTEAKGVWMDMMVDDWIDSESIKIHLLNGKEVAITSSELHGRNHLPFWIKLKEMGIENDVYLCTKFPQEAEKFFTSQD